MVKKPPYFLASSVSGQEQLNPTLWLANTPLRGSEILFWGRSLKFFTPFVQLSPSCHIFWLNTVKGTAIDLVSLKTLRGTKTEFLTPEK